jgi:hypothetical protein
MRRNFIALEHPGAFFGVHHCSINRQNVDAGVMRGVGVGTELFRSTGSLPLGNVFPWLDRSYLKMGSAPHSAKCESGGRHHASVHAWAVTAPPGLWTKSSESVCH